MPKREDRAASRAGPATVAAPGKAVMSGRAGEGAAGHDSVVHRVGHVMMLGLRGVPDVQGGVEKHVEMLAGRLCEQGWRVEVVGRRSHLPQPHRRDWRGVRVTPLWAPRHVGLEALVHTFLGVIYAGWRRPDILHVHAIGPGLMVPLARLFGQRVVVTHHGYDYDRQKWGRLAKSVLRLGERFGMRMSQGRIAVSADIARTVGARHHVDVDFVPNGVAVTRCAEPDAILESFGVKPRRYILLAARIVPEKRQLDLIRAFARLGDPGLNLVLAGDDEFNGAYAGEVRALAAATPGVVLAGFQSGERLAALFDNAALFVLPSSHEGMPIALLEAMAYGLPVLASDIVANKELDLPEDDYFPLGDVDALADALAAKLADLPSEEAMREQAAAVGCAYSWASIADRTAALYRRALGS
jgi:glycosyltransferase involved in cell wall biosynthesis